MDLENPHVWVVAGQCTGDNHSCFALARALTKSEPFIIDEKDLAKTNPQALSQATPSHAIPDIVVTGSGLIAMTAPQMSKLLRTAFPKTKIIFSNNAYPEWAKLICPEQDVIIAPSHLPPLDDPRVIKTFGILHDLSLDRVEREAAKWQSRLNFGKAPVVEVLLGGSCSFGHFKPEHAQCFGKMVQDFVQTHDANLLITNSRRTSHESSRAFMAEIQRDQVYFHDTHCTDNTDNPYFAYLGAADIIVVTGDSISMMCQAAWTGKPVHIHTPFKPMREDHQKMAELLVEEEFAVWFDGKRHTWQLPKFPDSVTQVANDIQRRFRPAPEMKPFLPVKRVPGLISQFA